MSEAEDSARARFRYEARTILNHIVGFGDLLVGDVLPGTRRELRTQYKAIASAALALRSPVHEYLGSVIQGNEPPEALKRQVLDGIHHLELLVNTARTEAPDDTRAIGDIQKVFEASEALAHLFGESERMESTPIADEALSRASMQPEKRRISGRILVVDDDAFNREILSRHLERQGHVVCQAANGKEAFSILSEAPFDIAVLDVMMTGMNGFQFLEALRDDERLRDISSIVVSALDDPVYMARCIELGAEDYLPRDFDPVLLKARIDSLLEKKRYKRQNDEALRRLIETQERLAGELRDAAAYVTSLLPKRMRWRGVSADWEFIPSLSLGGDCFYYHKLDNNRLALYLLDVSGHGIQAALLSATIMNMLRGLSLAGVDFAAPSSVLWKLNKSFRIEDQNNMFFTIWYGVYDASTGTLKYASAGSPPAILIGPDGKTMELTGDGPVIGVDETAIFGEFDIQVQSGSNLYLFSDGLFEVRTKSGDIMPWDDFMNLLSAHHKECIVSPACLSPIKRIVDSVRSMSSKSLFDDDVSIVEFAFDA